MRSVEFLCYPGCLILDVAGPLQAFALANKVMTDAGSAAPYDLRIVGKTPVVTTSEGVVLQAAALSGPGSPIDTLVVPGGEGVHAANCDAEILAWMIERAGTARRTAAVCGGTFLLAAAGLLHGKRAVTHWSALHRLRAEYPGIRVEDDPIFIEDGSIWTTAGVTAGIDLALALIERDFDQDVAMDVARLLLVPYQRSGGQSQFGTALKLQHNSSRFRELHSWIQANLASAITLASLAAQVGMSTRSFSRHYRAEMGQPPLAMVEELRFEQACRLLEQGHPIKQVVTACGFGSQANMRRVFASRIGVSPATYAHSFS